MSDVLINDSTVVQAATQAAVQSAPVCGHKDASGWEGVEDTDPALELSHRGYLMLEERCLGRIDPRNDEPIDFVPVEARCAEQRAEEQVP